MYRHHRVLRTPRAPPFCATRLVEALPHALILRRLDVFEKVEAARLERLRDGRVIYPPVIKGKESFVSQPPQKP